MKTLTQISPRALALTATLAIAATTAAAALKSAPENDAVADLRLAKISLADAIARTQSQFGGQAVRAELDGESGKPIYDIELVQGQSVQEVRLDAVSGKVLSNKMDEADGEAEEKDAPVEHAKPHSDARS